MKILGLDTATLSAGIAIVDGDRVLADVRHDASHRTNDLLVAIDRVCRDANVAPTGFDAIAIGAGPGSFTGLRIGMATAKGIAFAAGRPLYACSSLAALARDADQDGLVVAALDARRGEIYAGAYRDRGRTLVDVERVMSPADFLAWLPTLGDAPVCSGDAIEVHAELAHLRWAAARTPSGASVALLADRAHDILTGGAPTYIRPSEAEVKYPDGVPGALRKRP